MKNQRVIPKYLLIVSLQQEDLYRLTRLNQAHSSPRIQDDWENNINAFDYIYNFVACIITVYIYI